MLCKKCCVADMMKGGSPVNMDINELGVTLCSKTSSFVCILTVECKKKLHSYTIESPRRAIPSDDKGMP